MKASFKDFFIEHLWLFVVCVLLPIVVVDLFCYFQNYDLEQGSVATIVIGVITYIGTILWGMFIYYKSWVDKKIQIYKDRPLVDISVRLSHRNSPNIQMYEKKEVEELLNNELVYVGTQKTEMCKYILVTITNYGASLLSDITLCNVILTKGFKVIKPANNGYISSANPPKTIMYKDKWEMYVAVDKSKFNELGEGNKNVVIILQFKQNITNIFYAIVTVSIIGSDAYGMLDEIYTDCDYAKECTKRWLLKKCKNEIQI